MMGGERLVSILLVLIAACAPGRVFADIEGARLKQARTARSLAALERGLGAVSRLEEARAGCEAELASDRPPTRCFGVLDSERGLRLIGASQARFSISWLESLCRDRADRQNDARALRSSLSHPALSRSCREALRRRLEEVEYMDAARRPVFLFRSRLR